MEIFWFSKIYLKRKMRKCGFGLGDNGDTY